MNYVLFIYFFLSLFVLEQMSWLCDSSDGVKGASRYEEGMSVEPVAWESFAWRSGAEEYRFNIKDRGLIGHISVSDGRNFALPIVV